MAGDRDIYRKWHLGYQMVTCPMTSRDPTAGGLAEVAPISVFFLVLELAACMFMSPSQDC